MIWDWYRGVCLQSILAVRADAAVALRAELSRAVADIHQSAPADAGATAAGGRRAARVRVWRGRGDMCRGGAHGVRVCVCVCVCVRVQRRETEGVVVVAPAKERAGKRSGLAAEHGLVRRYVGGGWGWGWGWGGV